VRFGVSVETTLTEWLSTRAEVNYVQNGGVVQRQVTFDGGATELREVARYRINYLTVPLLAKVEVPGWKDSIRPSLFAGPTLGINVDWHSKSELEEFQTEPQFASFSSGVGPDPIQVGEVRPVMFSAVAGAEIDYRLPSGRAVALEVRYRRGLTAAVGRDVVDRTTARTDAISVGLRYVFSR
jgi:hypothetical protein